MILGLRIKLYNVKVFPRYFPNNRHEVSFIESKDLEVGLSTTGNCLIGTSQDGISKILTFVRGHGRTRVSNIS